MTRHEETGTPDTDERVGRQTDWTHESTGSSAHTTAGDGVGDPDGRVTNTGTSTGGRPARLLSAHHRAILASLAARGGTASPVVLARDMAARRERRSAVSAETGEIRRIYTDLCETTLTELARRGFVEYAPDDGSVSLTTAVQECWTE